MIKANMANITIIDTEYKKWLKNSALRYRKSQIRAAVKVNKSVLPQPESDVAQYSLESSSQPIAISSYELEKFYPVKVEGSIPSTEEIEANLLERINKG